MSDTTREKMANILDDLVNIEMSARFHNTDWAEYELEEFINAEVLAVLERLENQTFSSRYGSADFVPLSAIAEEKQNYAKQ